MNRTLWEVLGGAWLEPERRSRFVSEAERLAIQKAGADAVVAAIDAATGGRLAPPSSSRGPRSESVSRTRLAG